MILRLREAAGSTVIRFGESVVPCSLHVCVGSGLSSWRSVIESRSDRGGLLLRWGRWLPFGHGLERVLSNSEPWQREACP